MKSTQITGYNTRSECRHNANKTPEGLRIAEESRNVLHLSFLYIYSYTYPVLRGNSHMFRHLGNFSSLKMEAVHISKTLVPTYLSDYTLSHPRYKLSS